MTLVSERPGPGQARPYTFPRIVRLRVAGGQVLAAHLPGRPLAVAALLLDAGASREPDGREGTASVLLKAIEEGTAVRDATAFALAMERLGASLFTSVDWDSAAAGVEAPTDRLLAAVGLLAEAVRTPRLDPDDLNRVRDDEVSALRMEWANPGPRADAALRAALFGHQRPGRPAHGDPDSVAGLRVEDLSAFHERWLRRPGVLLVAGDLDRLDLSSLGSVAFAGTGEPTTPESGLVGAELAGSRRIILVDRPGAVQSTLRLGHLGPHRAHPDHVPVTLAGTVLGGAFTSRLNHLIREVRGYTYGIRGEFVFSRRFGRFTVSTSVQTAVTGPALADTVAEIVRTRAEGVTEDELAVARTWRAGQLSVEMQTPAAITDALATLVTHDLPDDYHAMLRERLLSTSVADASRAALAHLRPDDLVIVVEGDAAVVRADLASTGLGEVVDAVG
ncbi:pitrilysin family protein [Pilimelia columellifera]|uniref:Pitrilysin family protein n=1 Tax=Pilimelia columellifera subsp. columellifera TaxID=706583 RepID=A0ABP6B0F7_9ACTN